MDSCVLKATWHTFKVVSLAKFLTDDNIRRPRGALRLARGGLPLPGDPLARPAAAVLGEWHRQRRQSVAHRERLRVHLAPGPRTGPAIRGQCAPHALQGALVFPPRQPRDFYGLCGPLGGCPCRDYPGAA